MSNEGRRPLESVGEEISVTTAEVDSIRGAKPEPEERPAFVVTTLDANTGKLAPAPDVASEGVQSLLLKNNPTVRTEYNVDELARLIGKTCRNCKHFNHQFGQRLIEQEMQFGSPEDVDRWRNVIAEIAVWQPHLAGEEYVSTIDENTLPAEREILRMGLCQAMSSPGENTFTHPDCFCGSMEITGQDLFEAKTKEIGQSIQSARDRLLGAAGAKVPSIWQKLKGLIVPGKK